MRFAKLVASSSCKLKKIISSLFLENKNTTNKKID